MVSPKAGKGTTANRKEIKTKAERSEMEVTLKVGSWFFKTIKK